LHRIEDYAHRRAAVLLDCMPLQANEFERHQIQPFDAVLRVVRGVRGTVPTVIELSPRFDDGAVAPWVRGVGR
jgi:hypothetical protein